MTTIARAPAARRRIVYGATGQPIATVNPARSTWLSSLLAECDAGHCYLVPEGWPADDTGCPRCKLLGIT